ncbi:MAG: glycosyltransferase [Planctomycetes bacterium]|nr:glycosyltransferase [Planctomycetota bacterium]
METPLLSLCMIVKDGGASLTRCLASVRGVVDEIVVVDTGSRDDSVARAQAAGARVLHHRWDDDFAAARNVSLDAARGQWILALDCDEWFATTSPAGLRGALAKTKYVGYFLPIVSALAGGEQLDSTILRLWRHSPRVRFRFPIHEQVLPDLEAVAAETGQRFAVLEDLRVVHDGYTPDAIAAHGKVERNLKLFRKAIAQHEGEPYLWYKFADFMRGQGERKREALPIAERALELARAAMQRDSQRLPYFAELLTIVCASRLEAGRKDEALALLDEVAPRTLASPAYSYVAALAREANGELDAALDHVQECVTARRTTHQTAWRPSLAGTQAQALGARLQLRRGDPAGALAFAEQALATKPGYPAAVQLKADALVAAQRAGDAVQFLLEEARARPESSRVWQQLGTLLLRLGQPAQAQKCLARAKAEGD